MTSEVKGELAVFRVDIDPVRVGQVVEKFGANFEVDVWLPVAYVGVRVVTVPVLLSDCEETFPAEVIVLVSVDVPGDGWWGPSELSKTTQF